MPKPDDAFSVSEMCACVGKSSRYIRSLQAALGLYIAPNKVRYDACYVAFMRRVVALRTFNIPIADIKELLAKEVKILEMLNFDTMSDSPFWYMASGEVKVPSPRHLVLTGQDLGFDITEGDVQCNLDFAPREGELFDPGEMGESIHHALELYQVVSRKMDKRVRGERSVLLEALAWVGNGLLP
ncbi:MAG: hypothetical protein ACI9X0_000173 [Kiritimatiellia bacterium]|jgi:hypothetical protein